MAAQSYNTNINSLPSAAMPTSTPYSHATLAEDLPTLTGLAPCTASYKPTSKENHFVQQVAYPRGKQIPTPRQSSLRSTGVLSIPRMPIPRFLGRYDDYYRNELHKSYGFSPKPPRTSSSSRLSVTERQDLFIGTDPNEPRGVCTALKTVFLINGEAV